MNTFLDWFCCLGILGIIVAGIRYATHETPSTIFLGLCFVVLLLAYVLTREGKARR